MTLFNIKTTDKTLQSLTGFQVLNHYKESPVYKRVFGNYILDFRFLGFSFSKRGLRAPFGL